MENQASFDDEYLVQARALVQHLEAGETENANDILEELTRLRERDLFQQLGRLTRELHEALTNFGMDTNLATLAEKEIPDAKHRLNHVIELTEQAANRTMDLIDQSVPLSQDLEQRAGALSGEWERLRRREMAPDEFRELARNMEEYLTAVQDNSATLRSQLNEIMVAQDFQDLTGQVLRRVIQLVQDVEDNLVGLLKISGDRMREDETTTSQSGATAPCGPAVPGLHDEDVVGDQDEVDDLLSSLGF